MHCYFSKSKHAEVFRIEVISIPCADPKNSIMGWGGGPENFLVLKEFHRPSAPVFLRKFIAI